MAIAVEVDTVQGIVGGNVWFHLDVDNDVLYLRDQATRNQRVFGEETPEGLTVLRTDGGRIAGATVIAYWARFGTGDLNEASIHTVKDRVAAWMQRSSLGLV